MSTFTIDANGTEMGEYRAATAQDAHTAYVHDSGYASVADMIEVTGIDAYVWIHQIDTDALTAAFNEKKDELLFQDSYGDGVAVLADGTRFQCYADIATAIDMTLYDFVLSTVSEADLCS